VSAVDPSAAQIEHARKRMLAERVDFRVADAQALPFTDAAFDVVAAALVINFIPDRPAGLTEMRRVCCPGGQIAGFVWDLASERASTSPLVRTMRKIGMEAPPVPGTKDSSLQALQALFEQAGLDDIAVMSIDITVAYPDFDTYWRSQTPAFSPHGKVIAALSERDRLKLIEAIRGVLPISRDGSIAYPACANAIKSRVPR
jgi:SAM-dependent methyltransferase